MSGGIQSCEKFLKKRVSQPLMTQGVVFHELKHPHLLGVSQRYRGSGLTPDLNAESESCPPCQLASRGKSDHSQFLVIIWDQLDRFLHTVHNHGTSYQIRKDYISTQNAFSWPFPITTLLSSGELPVTPCICSELFSKPRWFKLTFTST